MDLKLCYITKDGDNYIACGVLYNFMDERIDFIKTDPIREIYSINESYYISTTANKIYCIPLDSALITEAELLQIAKSIKS